MIVQWIGYGIGISILLGLAALALEHGLDSGYAEIIRKQVRTIR